MKNNDVSRSVDVVISINGQYLGGQQGAVINRSAQPINITNKINPEWQENLGGTKTWSISCNGVYIIDSKSLNELEEAFMNNTTIEVIVVMNQKRYYGEAIITNFPLTTNFSQSLRYNLSLLGTGALVEIPK